MSPRLVYEWSEAKVLKSLFNVSTPLECDLFESSKRPAKVTLRAGEDVYIPMLYSSNTTKQEFQYTVSHFLKQKTGKEMKPK